MSEYSIVPLDKDNHGLVQSYLDLGEAVERHDWLDFVGWNPAQRLTELVQHSSSAEHERYAAVDGNRVLGWFSLTLPVRDNTHSAQIELEVHPDHRRAGIGTALLGRAEARVAELGRDTIYHWTLAPYEGGPALGDAAIGFAAAVGYRNTLTSAVSVCDLDKVDDADLQRLWSSSWERAEGFELVEFEGAPPADVIDGLAQLQARMYTDMPLGEWDLQEADFDAERVLEISRLRRERGELHLQAVVRHNESGDIAGFTEVIIESGRERFCFQGDTIVDPRFRGLRLGTILKIANQRRIRAWRPKMRYVWTGNAESNNHMIAINEAVGYRRMATYYVHQKKLG